MFRKLSLLVIVASFVGIRADGPVESAVTESSKIVTQTVQQTSNPEVTKTAKKAAESTVGLGTRFADAIRGAGSATKDLMKTVVNPYTYINATKSVWNTVTSWEELKKVPGNALSSVQAHPYRTIFAAAIVAAAVVEYQTCIIRDAFFSTDEDEDETKEGEVYFVGKRTKNQE